MHHHLDGRSLERIRWNTKEPQLLEEVEEKEREARGEGRERKENRGKVRFDSDRQNFPAKSDQTFVDVMPAVAKDPTD